MGNVPSNNASERTVGHRGPRLAAASALWPAAQLALSPRQEATVSVGESVRILRELQELSQNQLAEASGISQATISAIENDRVRLGVERAKVLARALKCHPRVLVFPGWTHGGSSAAELLNRK